MKIIQIRGGSRVRMWLADFAARWCWLFGLEAVCWIECAVCGKEVYNIDHHLHNEHPKLEYAIDHGWRAMPCMCADELCRLPVLMDKDAWLATMRAGERPVSPLHRWIDTGQVTAAEMYMVSACKNLLTKLSS